jgi:hypothetical protein
MSRRRSGLKLVALAFSAACVALTLEGCGGPPQVTGHNREIIVSLASAISAKNADWLEKNAKTIERHKAEGTLSEGEHAALSAIVLKAREGKWDDAEEAVYALRDAQEPSAEDLKNLQERRLAPEHAVPKNLNPRQRPRNH